MSNSAKSGIYAITNTTNGKLYVGSAVNFKVRWNVHLSKLRKGDHHSVIFQRAWNKYGEQSFVFSVLENVQDRSILLEVENKWIRFYDAANKEFGYNICKVAGSQLGLTRSEATKEKMSVARKGKKKSVAHQEKINAALKGRNLTDEHKAKLSKARTGSKASDKARENMKAAQVTRSISDDAYSRMVAGNLGNKQTDEHKMKISNALKGRKLSDAHRAALSVITKNRKRKPLEGYLLKSKLANI